MSLWRKLNHFRNRRRFERDLDEEMRFHVEVKALENERAGLAPAEAAAAARRAFGSTAYMMETSRELWAIGWLERLAQDTRYALRGMRSTPAFTAVMVLTLALGIGANTAVFSLVDAVVLRGLPVRDPEQLVRLEVHHDRGKRMAFSYPFYQDLRDINEALSGAFARQSAGVNLTDGGSTERVRAELVTGNYFGELGVRAAQGRLIGPADDRIIGGHPVCVLGFDYWRRRFGRDVVGREVLLNGQRFTVIGVSEEKFTGTEPGQVPDLRVPMMMQRSIANTGKDWLSTRRARWLMIFGRLKPGISMEQARAALDVTVARIASAHPGFPENGRVVLHSARQGFGGMRKRFGDPLLVLAAVVGTVLLIACANLANLLLARAGARQREMAVRMAIGAGRARLVRQLLTESLLMALIGGAVGLLAAAWALKAVVAAAEQGYGLKLDAAADWRVFAFALAVTVAIGIAFGLAPAAARVELNSVLKHSTRAAARLGFRKGLVAAQVALSLILLVGAGLFIGTLAKLRSIDGGFNAGGVAMVSLDPRLSGYSVEASHVFYERLLERIRALPGVQAAGIALLPPLANGYSLSDLSVSTTSHSEVHRNFASDGYFATTRIPLLAGRDFTPRDRAGAPKVAIVNQAVVRKFFQDRNPVGARISFDTGPNPALDVEVVGVVRDTTYRSLRDEMPPIVYTPPAQELQQALTVLARCPGDASALIPAVRAEVAALDRNVPVTQPTTLSAQVDHALATERLLAAFSGLFGAIALSLAAVGLYGVLAFTVGRRTQEIGLRMALGASRASVLSLVLRDVTLPAGIGLALGLAAAAALARFVASLLYGVEARDPRVFAGTALLLAAVALAAALLPARRAARLDPASALRYE